MFNIGNKIVTLLQYTEHLNACQSERENVKKSKSRDRFQKDRKENDIEMNKLKNSEHLKASEI